MLSLIDRLNQPGVLVADGATGTMLVKAGLPRGSAPERWNLENHEAVRTLHRNYIEAGSDIVLTNTFGGTSYRLVRDNLSDRVIEINREASRLAREIAGEKIYVFGDIGPLGQLLQPLGTLSYEDALQAFEEQVTGLTQGQLDAILIETMADISEAKAAIEGTRRVSNLPILVTMSFDTRGRTMMGLKPEQAARELTALGVEMIGANCGRTLSETLAAIQAMREVVPDALLVAKPNAGLPRREPDINGQTTEIVYDVSPAEMAEYALKFSDQGVRIFGGCCGSTPDHIRAISKVLKQ